MHKLTLKDQPIKELLKLFGTQEALEILELGDTWHPSSGFVDETYFKEIRTVGDFLSIGHDFRGLVLFTAKVGGLLFMW